MCGAGSNQGLTHGVLVTRQENRPREVKVLNGAGHAAPAALLVCLASAFLYGNEGAFQGSGLD